jgi:uncharacterized membrane protein (DUF2068 family)
MSLPSHTISLPSQIFLSVTDSKMFFVYYIFQLYNKCNLKWRCIVVLQKIFLMGNYVHCYREQRFISTWGLKCCSRWTEGFVLCLVTISLPSQIFLSVTDSKMFFVYYICNYTTNVTLNNNIFNCAQSHSWC